MVFSLYVRLNNFIQKVIIIHGMNKNRDKRKKGTGTGSVRKKRSSRTKSKRRGSFHSRQGRSITLRKSVMVIIISLVIVTGVLAARELFFYINGTSGDSGEPYPVKGVDVSSYQKDIDWDGLEKEGFSFAFIKATEGSSHVDSRFSENWKNAGRTGMKIGAYHFLSYDTPGASQADNFINTVNKKWGMLPPVVDVEFYGRYLKKHPERDKMYEILDPVLEKLEKKYGHKPIIYTNTYIYNTYISGVYDNHPVWISNPDIPDALPDGREWFFCQYTFYGRSENVAGGEKYVDMNVFSGNEWEFRKHNWE